MDFQAKGRIVYDPIARGNIQNSWWLILECPMDIIEYYYHWILKEEGVKLNKPLFGAHISIVRGEEPPEDKKSLWKKYEDKSFNFAYKYEVETNGEYWWLRVYCDELKSIRKELGLQEEVEFDFHLTIGKEIK